MRQLKLILISNSLRSKNIVITVCYDNFIRPDECFRLHCEYGITVGASAVDIEDTIFKNFYRNVTIRK